MPENDTKVPVRSSLQGAAPFHLEKTQRGRYTAPVPTVLREKGFQVMIYLEDHLPPHVHVMKENAVAVIVLEGLYLREIKGKMSRSDAMKAKKLVAQHGEFLLAEWKRIVGE